MIDTYEKDNKVVLLHQSFAVDKLIHPGKSPQPIEGELKEIDLFLKSNPQAVVSIFLRELHKRS